MPEAAHGRRCRSLVLRTAVCKKPSGERRNRPFPTPVCRQCREESRPVGKAKPEIPLTTLSFPDSFRARGKAGHCSHTPRAFLRVRRPQRSAVPSGTKLIPPSTWTPQENSKGARLKDRSVTDAVQTRAEPLACPALTSYPRRTAPTGHNCFDLNPGFYMQGRQMLSKSLRLEGNVERPGTTLSQLSRCFWLCLLETLVCFQVWS